MTRSTANRGREPRGRSSRWFFTNDIAPLLPRIFLILCQNLWLFSRMRDRMPERRAWIQELLLRADALEDRAQAELLLISAATALEVGDDDSAQAAVEGIERLPGGASTIRIPRPGAAQLAVSWILPIADDFDDGSLHAALTALDGFREQNEPFMAWAALTAGLLEMTLGRHDAALNISPRPTSSAAGSEYKWLQSGARTQLASLAVSAGQLEEAEAQLVESVDVERRHRAQHPNRDLLARRLYPARPGRRNVRRAAMALGAADGLRRRAGVHRACLAIDAAGRGGAGHPVRAEIDSDAFKDALAAGSELNRLQAVALLRGDRMVEV